MKVNQSLLGCMSIALAGIESRLATTTTPEIMNNHHFKGHKHNSSCLFGLHYSYAADEVQSFPWLFDNPPLRHELVVLLCKGEPTAEDT